MKALVVGGSGTIGRAIVHDLLSRGYEVILTYYQTPQSTLISQYEGQPVQLVHLDVSQPIEVEVLENIHNIDALIYVSGRALYGMLQDMTSSQIHEAYHMHVYNFIKITQYFVNQLIASDHGRIIVMSSIWGEAGASFETIYSAMKAAQIGFVKALSQELALTQVTVNAIAPGVVAGKMSDELDNADLEDLIETLPQQRLIDPEEIAHTVSYLLSPHAKSITGTVQRINGGWYR
ncbi:elongation factor P 5-aminopentanone reductase [Staphylococcus sp. 17KM0847]|uniref:elongation factor P 5-aminopentanone reductase n=1 Tax=Staphylococcus sp. 17KM0847 TaxID=2583989 RepID=UPI0015DD3FDB|nr:SDR family oxidoreductase [Staphylococcus sp. 17KM0847]QLK85895.1 SDR family oxidoreductase [Staphylococcus sp. 17KM0847]